MDRRRFIQSVGVIGGVSTISTTASARDEGELPNDEVSVSQVTPYNPQTVPAGDWILHTSGWVEYCRSPEENRERVAEYFDSIYPVVTIDGERIENPEQYYGEIEPWPDRENAWAKLWQYYTPPKGVGEHSFEVEVHFTSDYLQKDFGECGNERQFEEGQIIVNNQGYTVEPAGGRNNGENRSSLGGFESL